VHAWSTGLTGLPLMGPCVIVGPAGSGAIIEVGDMLGASVGDGVGDSVGVLVGIGLGSFVGASVGAIVGVSLGAGVGSVVGSAVGGVQLSWPAVLKRLMLFSCSHETGSHRLSPPS